MFNFLSVSLGYSILLDSSTLFLSLCFSICSCFHMRLELIACSLRNRFNLSPRVDFMPHIRIHINEAPSARRGSLEDRSGASWLVAWLGSAWLGLTDSWGLPAGVDLYASIPHFYFFGCHLAKIFHISRHRAQLRAAPCQRIIPTPGPGLAVGQRLPRNYAICYSRFEAIVTVNHVRWARRGRRPKSLDKARMI